MGTASEMRVLIATDAWAPHVDGVVRTLTALARSAPEVGMDIVFLSPEGFSSVPVPSDPGLHLAIPDRHGIAHEIARRIEAARPDAIHLATERPIGHAVRASCLGALTLSRAECRAECHVFVLGRSWEASARQFARNAARARIRRPIGPNAPATA